MAIGLINFPNIISPDSDFPSGRIKDNPGDFTGTPMNQLTNGDLQEFFAKIMREVDLTPNGIPDSEYTGNQYYQALLMNMFQQVAVPIVKSLIGTYTENDVIVLYGFNIVVSGSTATWTDGAIFYNDAIYLVAAGSTTKTSGIFLYTISDPYIFTASIGYGSSGYGIADYGSSTVKTYQGIVTGLYTLTPFTLSNSYGADLSAPSYYKDVHGNVRFRGQLTSPLSVTSPLFATLPAGYRPLQTCIFNVGQYFSASGGNGINVWIAPDGTCKIFKYDNSNVPGAGAFSLDMISFPTAF